MFEALEGRQLLAGVAPQGGLVLPITNIYQALVIEGTAAPDTIYFSQNTTQISVALNGVTTQYAITRNGSALLTRYVYTRIVVNGMAGNDSIQGGSDVALPMEIRGGFGNDYLVGGIGNDFITGGTGAAGENGGVDTLDGDAGDDLLFSSDFGRAMLYGYAGNDTLTGGALNDTLWGEAGDDLLQGNDGNDSLSGGDGNDWLFGHNGLDSLSGGNGNDSLNGGANNDLLAGNDGSDSLDGEGGADDLQGNAGTDSVFYGTRVSDLVITFDNVSNDGSPAESDNVRTDNEILFSGAGNDVITGSGNAETINGGAGNDTVRGRGGNDLVLGEDGMDVLFGEDGNDILFGGLSNDRMFGGAGNDQLNGDEGNDTLVAIGGGILDQLIGASGFDSFWSDADASEIVTADAFETASRNVHRVGVFSNGASKELLGQDLPDPILIDAASEHYPASHTEFDSSPLFAWDGPLVNEANQGGVGDCWFIAPVLSIVRTDPNVIKQSVVDLGDGTYAAMFFENGSPRFYRVDNDLARNRFLSVAYAQQGTNGALWLPILEKAYTFHDGGGEYDGIAGGYAEDAYDDFNISTTEIDVDDDDAKARIIGAINAGKPITATSSWEISGFDVGDVVVPSHVYEVVAINGNSITLRNPWGSDAGSDAGSFIQGANDGFVTFDWNFFVNEFRFFTVGNI